MVRLVRGPARQPLGPPHLADVGIPRNFGKQYFKMEELIDELNLGKRSALELSGQFKPAKKKLPTLAARPQYCVCSVSPISGSRGDDHYG
ncbi:unnamed protein product [Caenorhabditis auriculariae]|uniref:Uncharacterized protein n=1 Tax=Caenorhabditis auriculariae TaxID=2777116 RepID=A0A8S1HJ92_9PELO|nr:unnamed protein product [Caenorhabditis auriculariae]